MADGEPDAKAANEMFAGVATWKYIAERYGLHAAWLAVFVSAIWPIMQEIKSAHLKFLDSQTAISVRNSETSEKQTAILTRLESKADTIEDRVKDIHRATVGVKQAQAKGGE